MLGYGCSVLSVVHELCGYVCNQFPRNFIIWFLRVPRALAFVVIWYLMQGGHLWLEGKGERLQQALHCRSTLVVVFSEVTLLSVTDPLGPSVHVKSIGNIGSASYRIPALEEIVVGCRNQCSWSFMNFYYEEAKTKVCMRMKWLLLCPCTSCISLPTYICSSCIGYGMPPQLFLMLD